MLTHQVYFWLKEPLNHDASDQLEKGLKELLTIGSIKSGHLGIPATTPPRDVVDDSYSFAYYTTIESMDDHEEYQIHPVHLKFVETCQHLWDRVQIYDYTSAV